MARNLNVKEGTTTILKDPPSEQLVKDFKKVKVQSLKDLVSLGAIRSEKTLDQLLKVSKAVTNEALTDPDTHRPKKTVPERHRADLRRFGLLVAKTQDVNPLERDLFWRTVRDIEPTKFVSITVASPIADVIKRGKWIRVFEFGNVTVEPNAILEVGENVDGLVCKELLIRRTGKIVAKGGGAFIKAFSIQGEQ